MKLPEKKFITVVALPLILFCLCFSGLPGVAGTASADRRFTGKDDTKVKDFCKSALGKNASQIEVGACYQGYVIGYDHNAGRKKQECNSIYRNKPKAIQACRNQGYNGGLHNSAHVSSPRKKGGGGGGGGGGVAAGSAEKCGNNPAVGISIKIGCRGKGNPIADMAFAVIRVLSAGVGLVVIGSIVVGGIQYSASRGDPQATAQAINRIRSSFYALLIFIFGYALLNYIIPGAILR
jgi:hypothetical protein